MIQDLPLRLLEAAMNAALRLDSVTIDKLATFEGKTIKIFVKPFQFSFYLCFLNKQITLTRYMVGEPDATIESHPIGLIRLSLLPASEARSLFHHGVKMSGDVDFAQAVKAVMDEMDIDWEGHLARFTGDMIAYRVSRCVQKVKSQLQTVATSATFQLSAYLQEEAKLTPSRPLIKDFCDEVDALILDVERLEAKIKSLKPIPKSKAKRDRQSKRKDQDV